MLIAGNENLDIKGHKHDAAFKLLKGKKTSTKYKPFGLFSQNIQLITLTLATTELVQNAVLLNKTIRANIENIFQ